MSFFSFCTSSSFWGPDSVKSEQFLHFKLIFSLTLPGSSLVRSQVIESEALYHRVLWFHHDRSAICARRGTGRRRLQVRRRSRERTRGGIKGARVRQPTCIWWISLKGFSLLTNLWLRNPYLSSFCVTQRGLTPVSICALDVETWHALASWVLYRSRTA